MKILLENEPIARQVKNIAHRYDKDAQVILFGSSARGDWEEKSDWDFLILTDETDTEPLFKKIRNDVLEEIEWVSFDNIQTIVRKKKIWQENMWMTGIYESIQEEGKLV